MLVPLKGVSILSQPRACRSGATVQFHWFQPRPKAAIQKHSRGTSDATTKIGSQAPVFHGSVGPLVMVSRFPQLRGYQLGDHNPSER